MSLLASQIASLTCQIGRVCLQPTTFQPAGGLRSEIAQLRSLALRSFASKKKGGKKSKKKKSTKKQPPPQPRVEPAAALQHQEWVDFQQSIAVADFETGQTVTVQHTRTRRSGQKSRRDQRRELVARLAERKRRTTYSAGRTPPFRYSDEETERLLAEAYAAIPPRAGKRGTRNLKRQHLRWFRVRKARKKYKKQLVKAHEREMLARQRKIRLVKQVLAAAPDRVRRDREYQLHVYQQWANRMVQDQQEM